MKQSEVHLGYLFYTKSIIVFLDREVKGRLLEYKYSELF